MNGSTTKRPATGIKAQAFLLLQRILPQHFLMTLVARIAEIRVRPIKDFLITSFVRIFEVDTTEARHPVPDGYLHFNDFFTRELKEGARPVDASPLSIVSPVDGILSAAGRIDGDALLQAKGIHYTLEDLLATDLADAASFADGSFATMYLAPYNYHRVHSPLAGRLVAARYVPGHLYSVNQTTVELLPRLFTRNERLVCHFRTEAGPLALIFVGALNVGSVSTPWTGRIRPRKTGVVDDLDTEAPGVSAVVEKGGMVGWFNMGSTVILLLPPDACAWRDDLVNGSKLRMGEPIGTLLNAAG
jgi:phosphatidylserine decarboxylase